MIICYFIIGLVYSLSTLMMNVRLWKLGYWPEYGEYNLAFRIGCVIYDFIFWPFSVALDIFRTIKIIMD